MTELEKNMLGALTLALAQLEEWEVLIDSEWGNCRTLEELETDRGLCSTTLMVREVIKEANKYARD